MEGERSGVGSVRSVIFFFVTMEETASTIHSDQFLWQRRLEEDQRRDRVANGATESDENEKNPTLRQAARSLHEEEGAKQRSGSPKKVLDAVQDAKKIGQIVSKTGGKTALRIINGGSAATIVGIIITVIIMHFQFIFGNLLGGSILPAPKLDWWEIAILFILDVLVAVVVGAIVVIVYYLLNPLQLIENSLQQIGPAAQQSNPGAWNPFDPRSKL